MPPKRAPELSFLRPMVQQLCSGSVSVGLWETTPGKQARDGGFLHVQRVYNIYTTQDKTVFE